MIEAVGEAYWPKYFEKLRHCLVRDGIAVIQAITIAEERFEAYRKEPDFIQQRIFPGGMLPTVNAIKRHAQEAGFDIMHMEFFGDSYAQTLAEWRRRFNRAWPKVRPLGFDQRFKRLWNYYLVYCEAGFRYRATDVGVYVFRPMELPNGLK
jgi:cyclopropane-fatty-acyl-phospholipid synthase